MEVGDPRSSRESLVKHPARNHHVSLRGVIAILCGSLLPQCIDLFRCQASKFADQSHIKPFYKHSSSKLRIASGLANSYALLFADGYAILSCIVGRRCVECLDFCTRVWFVGTPGCSDVLLKCFWDRSVHSGVVGKYTRVQKTGYNI